MFSPRWRFPYLNMKTETALWAIQIDINTDRETYGQLVVGMAHNSDPHRFHVFNTDETDRILWLLGLEHDQITGILAEIDRENRPQ